MAGEGEIKIENDFHYPLPTFDLYREGLVHRLEIPQEPQGEDRKDLRKWLSSVSFMENGEAPLKGMIHYRGERGLIQLSSEKPLPEVITSKTQVSDVLEVQARTAAKLAFVGELDIIPIEVRREAGKLQEKIDKQAKGILDNLSKQREVKIGKMPSITRRQFLEGAVKGAGVLALQGVLAACGVRMDASPTASPSRENTSKPAASETINPPTATPGAGETPKPTDTPPFTEKEIEAADPFDLTTFPPGIIEIQNHPENATDAQLENAHNFIVEVREKEGILPIFEFTNRIWSPDLGSLWNLGRYVQSNLEMFRREQKEAVISFKEMKLMLEDNTIIYSWDTEKINNFRYSFGFDTGIAPFFENDRSRFYNPENIGLILGRDDIHPDRFPYISVGGNSMAIGTFAGREIALVDVMGQDGYHRLFPVVISFEPITLPKGSKCINTQGPGYPDPIFTLPEEITLRALRNGRGGPISREEVFAGLGRQVGFGEGMYARDIIDKFQLGLAGPYCFSPEGLEMASDTQINPYLEAKYWPWVAEVPKPR